MRGREKNQSSMLCLVSPEQFVPKGHPLREIKGLADEVLKHLNPVFDRMYARRGRPSIPPEMLLKSSLLMALYTIRSERQFCEQLGYNLMFRWFLDMDMTDEPFDASTFSKNRDRMMEHDVAQEFFQLVVESARSAHLLSEEHFSVDGTLIEAWASMKSFRPKEGDDRKDPPDDPGNPTVNFRGEKRRNETHASTTDPEAKLYRKAAGQQAKLCFGAHALMENRNGLLVDFQVSAAGPSGEWESAVEMLTRTDARTGATVGADKGYDVTNFVSECREIGITPHVAQRKSSRIDGRTTRHDGYSISQRIRKRVEEIFGWVKTVGGFRKTRYRGIRRTQMAAHLVGAAYNLLRIAKLMAKPA